MKNGQFLTATFSWSWINRPTWSPKVWYHVALTWAPKEKEKMYVNGQKVDEREPMDLSKELNVDQITIGGNPPNSADMLLDELAIFDKALTPEQVKALADSGGGTGEFTNGASGAGSIGGLLSAATWNSGSALGIDTTNAGGSLTYAGNISGLEGLAKLGTGTLVLSGTNSYTGATTVSGGSLILSGTGTSLLPTTATLTITNGAYVSLQSTTSYGGINKLGNGTLFLTNSSNTYGQGLQLNGGTVQFSNNALKSSTSPAGPLMSRCLAAFFRQPTAF
jgi:autotransporter-associated beta strand protein